VSSTKKSEKKNPKMKIHKCLKLAFNMLHHSKIRSWLSIIGIVIGVASVISILALGEGMQQDLEMRLGSLGADIITVSPGASRATGGMGGFRRGDFNERDDNDNDVKNLTNNDVQALKLVSNVKYVHGTISQRGDVGYLEETMSSTVKGVDTQIWKNMENSKLESGRYLSQGDKNVVVIGYNIAHDRFKQDIQLNRQITIEGKPFRVVGILEKASGMSSTDSVIFMPIEIVRITLEDIDKKKLDSIEIKVENVDLIEETVANIESRLMLTRAVNAKTKDFTVSSVQATQESIQATINTVTLFLSAIAAISLLVGAVGIANTMFTTVLEKIKEIGIMKSIGAKDRDILLIFLFNSAMIGFSGGIIGAALGFFGSQLLSGFFSGSGTGGMMRMMSGQGIVTLNTVLLVLGLSVLIGLLSGVIPAYRASKMNPVDALRYE